MITVLGFLGGASLMVLGFLMVWKRNALHQSVGDLSLILDFPQGRWLDWAILGVVVLVIGLLMALGLLQSVFSMMFGFFFRPSL